MKLEDAEDVSDMVAALVRWFQSQGVDPAKAILTCMTTAGILSGQQPLSVENMTAMYADCISIYLRTTSMVIKDRQKQ